MIDELSIVETGKVIHTVETDMVKLVVEIECFGTSFDEFDKETESSDGLQPMVAGSDNSSQERHHVIDGINGIITISEYMEQLDPSSRWENSELLANVGAHSIEGWSCMETETSDGFCNQCKRILSCVHALNEPHLHEIHVVPDKHEADQYVHVIE
ncbi:hypothetical protein Tco_0567428 [Tanacetum coccineum]